MSYAIDNSVLLLSEQVVIVNERHMFTPSLRTVVTHARTAQHAPTQVLSQNTQWTKPKSYAIDNPVLVLSEQIVIVNERYIFTL